VLSSFASYASSGGHGLSVAQAEGAWLLPSGAVDSEDWPSAAAGLSRIRQIIAVNLPLGLLVVVIGASGRYWG
jgi:hypothetical protein